MKTDIIVILDRSGSMQSCKEDAEGGLNSFIEEQKNSEGKVSFTLVEFDDEYNFVYKGLDINKVEPYTLVPRGMTALNDAVGKAINETGERLRHLPESERPDLVSIAIITDGGENASKEFSTTQIKEMIQHQESKYNWKFTFLGADQDSFANAEKLGIDKRAVSNYAKGKSRAMFASYAANVGRMQEAVVSGLTADCFYTDQEQEQMND